MSSAHTPYPVPFLRLVALLLVLLLTITAAAQDTLLQAAGQTTGIRLSATPELVAPDDLAEMNYQSNFQLLDTGAIFYKVTFKETATNVKHTFTVPFEACNGTTCEVLPLGYRLLPGVKDEMVLTWQVTALMPSGNIKSGTRTVTANTVEMPILSGPADGETLFFNTQLLWSNANLINDHYRIVMIDLATGKKVFNQFLDSHAILCETTCGIAPRNFTNKLKFGKTYKWYIRATGFNGESVKSEKRTVAMQ